MSQNHSEPGNPYQDLFVGQPGSNAPKEQHQKKGVTQGDQVDQFVQEAKSDLQEGALLKSNQKDRK